MGNNANVQLTKDGKLQKVMGFWDLVLYGLVFMYPLAAFNYLGFQQTSSGGHATLVYLGGGLIVLFTALSYSRWVESYPNTGSAYFFTCKGIGPKCGFMVGWVMMLDYILTPLFVLIMIGQYMAVNFPVLPYVAWMFIFAAVVFLINYLGLKLSKIFDISMMAIILIIAGSVSVLTVILLHSQGISFWNPEIIYNSETFDFGKVSMAAALVVLSFLGFDAITALSEESKCDAKGVSRAIIVAVVLQAALLAFLAYVGSCVFPDPDMIQNPDTVAYELYTAVGGEKFNFVMNLLSTFGLMACATSAATGATRILFAMGRDGVLPKKIFGNLNKKGVPAGCVIVVMAISFIGACFLDYATVAEIVSFGALFGFIFVNLGCINNFWIREKEKRVFRNLIFPVIGFAGAAFVMLTTAPICKIVGCIWVAAGIIYLILGWKKSSNFRDAITRGMDIE